MAFADGGRDHLPLGIHPNGQFLPAFALLLPMLLALPFALATDLQATAVNDQGDRPCRGTIALRSDHDRGVASRECRVIRARQRHIHQGQERMEKALGLAERQAKEQPKRARGRNGDVGIPRRGPSRAGPWRRPGVEGVWTEPQGDVTTSTERVVIRVPVLHAIGRLICGVSMGSFVRLRHAWHR